jgi:hypothetical protein
VFSEPASAPHRFPKRVLQLWALEIAQNLGPQAEECLSQIVNLTNSPDSLISKLAIKAVKGIGAENRK